MPVDFKALRDAALFHDLPDDALMALAQHCRYQELPAGHNLFQQSTPGDALYLLTDGQIHLERHYPDGQQVVLTTESPYYVIGELSMLSNQPRTATVVAVADCTLVALERDDFMQVCAEKPAMATALTQYLGYRLHRMNLLVRETAIRNVAARVASVLLLLADDEPGAIDGDVRVSRIARATATDADVVERILGEWVAQGYIDFDGRRLTIHNLDVIGDIAG
jgi:CRP-like cAMP-binding protein